jgi:hypothetical protein
MRASESAMRGVSICTCVLVKQDRYTPVRLLRASESAMRGVSICTRVLVKQDRYTPVRLLRASESEMTRPLSSHVTPNHLSVLSYSVYLLY